jgi:predicted dithiol-disulfide oxidoreductase (DUF899 family)
MAYGTKKAKLEELKKKLNGVRAEINEVRKGQEPEKVKNYEFKTSSGETVKLGDLFGDKKELFVVHNMGKKCPYCTLWADGFNGVIGHLENRAAFVVSSPDKPEVQSEFAKSRDWNFRMVSTAESPFAFEMGYQNERGVQPGVSVFVKSGNDILRVSDSEFGPGDDYCHVWHLFDLLPKGANEWGPKFIYGDKN